MRRFLPRKRVFFLVLLLGILVYAGFIRAGFSFEQWLAQASLQAVHQQLDDWGYLGYVVFVLVSALLCAVGMPRLLVCAAAGMVFGVWWGIVLSQAGVTLGAYATFAVARWSGADYFLHRWPRLGDLLDTVEYHGIASIFLIRQLPVSGFVANIVLGLSAVKQWKFLVGSFIGFLPEAIPAVFVGAGVQLGNVAYLAQLFVAAVLLMVFVSWLVKAFVLKAPQPYTGRRQQFEQALMVTCGVAGVALCAYTVFHASTA